MPREAWDGRGRGARSRCPAPSALSSFPVETTSCFPDSGHRSCGEKFKAAALLSQSPMATLLAPGHTIPSQALRVVRTGWPLGSGHGLECQGGRGVFTRPLHRGARVVPKPQRGRPGPPALGDARGQSLFGHRVTIRRPGPPALACPGSEPHGAGCPQTPATARWRPGPERNKASRVPSQSLSVLVSPQPPAAGLGILTSVP